MTEIGKFGDAPNVIGHLPAAGCDRHDRKGCQEGMHSYCSQGQVELVCDSCVIRVGVGSYRMKHGVFANDLDSPAPSLVG